MSMEEHYDVTVSAPINPCAIATLVFLTSFLATKKCTKSKGLIICSSFTTSVFLTYLAMGIGAFRLITAFEHYRAPVLLDGST